MKTDINSRQGAEQLTRAESTFDQVFASLGEGAYNSMTTEWDAARTVEQREEILARWAGRAADAPWI